MLCCFRYRIFRYRNPTTTGYWEILPLNKIALFKITLRNRIEIVNPRTDNWNLLKKIYVMLNSNEPTEFLYI